MERIFPLDILKIYEKELRIYISLNSFRYTDLILRKNELIIKINEYRYKNNEDIIRSYISQFFRRINLEDIPEVYFKKDILFGKILNRKLTYEEKIRELEKAARRYINMYYKKYFSYMFEEGVNLKIKDYDNYLNVANIRKNTIYLNSKCYILPRMAIKYIIFHEMLHSISRHHNYLFRSIERSFFPDNENIKNTILKYMFIASLNENI